MDLALSMGVQRCSSSSCFAGCARVGHEDTVHGWVTATAPETITGGVTGRKRTTSASSCPHRAIRFVQPVSWNFSQPT